MRRQCDRARAFPVLPPPLASGRYSHDNIRLAYISSDVGHHPVATQIVQLIESHDRGRFEVIGIGTNPDDGSPQRRRLVAAFDRFVDAHQQTPASSGAEQLRALEVDILVDLNGHTKGDNFDVLSHRPAPVQATWLGYAGTTAAPFVDYADRRCRWSRPMREAFTEKLALLPNCFFPSDTSRAHRQLRQPRQEAGLPEEGFCLLLLQQQLEDHRSRFSPCWMRLLAADARQRVVAETDGRKDQGQSAGGRAKPRHRAGTAGLRQARARWTCIWRATGWPTCSWIPLPYNAHATACDALWAGLPVLTRRGTRLCRARGRQPADRGGPARTDRRKLGRL